MRMTTKCWADERDVYLFGMQQRLQPRMQRQQHTQRRRPPGRLRMPLETVAGTQHCRSAAEHGHESWAPAAHSADLHAHNLRSERVAKLAKLGLIDQISSQLVDLQRYLPMGVLRRLLQRQQRHSTAKLQQLLAMPCGTFCKPA